MSVLLLRLAGPMQSWGTQSRFTIRDTGLEPSRSGVVGLLCAALGRPRTTSLEDFRALRMAVRVDRPGELRRDFHTAGGGRLSTRPQTVGGDEYGVIKASGAKGDTVVSHRDYLADADFLVALGGDRDFLKGLNESLARPAWPLFLGRKSFVPACPVRVPSGLRDGDDPGEVLLRYPWNEPERASQRPVPYQLRLVIEVDDPNEADGHPYDVPLCFAPRRFTTRHTRTRWIEEDQLRQIAVPAIKEKPCT